MWDKSQAKKIAKLCLLLKKLKKQEADKPKCIWVAEIFKEENRTAQGASDNLLRTMELYDKQSFYNFLRMTPELFDKLLLLVEPSISKQYTVRAPISATVRLQITLRYLATVDNLKSLAYLFRVSPSAIHNIISETSKAIWDCLKPIVFEDLNEATWRKIAVGFDQEWNFPHCLGAVDSKLVEMEVSCILYNYLLEKNHL